MDEDIPDRRSLSGTLLECGVAPFERSAANEASYFVKLRTARGEVTLWGVDLQRAIREARVQAGDEIQVSRLGREALPVTVKERDAQGQVVGGHGILAHRTRWSVLRVGPARAAEAASARSSVRQVPARGGSIVDASREPRIDPGAANPTQAAQDEQAALWRRIRSRYLVDEQGRYRLLAQPQRVAFTDTGPRLVTEHEDPVVVRAMLDVAQYKGWTRINLAGSETFQRIAWLEANLRGIETTGYAPRAEDRQRLGEWMAERGGQGAIRAGGSGSAAGATLADRSGVDRAAPEVPAPVPEVPKASVAEVVATPGWRGSRTTPADAAVPGPDLRAVVLAQRVPVMTPDEHGLFLVAKTDAEREEIRNRAHFRYVQEGLVIRVMNDEEIARYKIEFDAGNAERANAVLREARERQVAAVRAQGVAPGPAIVVKEESPDAFDAAQKQSRSAGADSADRDAVVLAVADEVLRQRRVGEHTRARIAAAITRRLQALRDQGSSVSVRMFDRAAQPAAEPPVEVSRARSVHVRAR